MEDPAWLGRRGDSKLVVAGPAWAGGAWLDEVDRILPVMVFDEFMATRATAGSVDRGHGCRKGRREVDCEPDQTC